MIILGEIFNIISKNKFFKKITDQKDKLKIQAKKIAAYSLIYTSLAITFLFTVGGAVFCIPPICAFFGLGSVSTIIVGGLCTIAAFWGSYVVSGVCLKDMVLKIAGLEDNNSGNCKVASKPGIAKYILVGSMLLFNAMFYIAGNYFAMLSLLPILGLSGNPLAIAASLVLSLINYIPTFALNGMSLINSELGCSKNTHKDNHEDEKQPSVVVSKTSPKAPIFMGNNNTNMMRFGRLLTEEHDISTFKAHKRSMSLP